MDYLSSGKVARKVSEKRGIRFMSKVWMVTGAARGMGRAITETALLNGDSVVAITRKDHDLDLSDRFGSRFLHLKLDIADIHAKAFDDVVKKAVEYFGRIDILVNNAGHGRITNFEETSEENIREIFELNVFGLMRMTRAVLPIMRKQKSGHIFNVASAAGYCAGPVAYHTSKYAVTGFSTCLAFEVEPFGIRVTNVAPGLFRTNFYEKGAMRTEEDIHIEDYDAVRWQNDFVKNNVNNQPGDPVKLSKLIYEVANIENPPLHLPVGADAVASVEGLIQELEQDVLNWKDKASSTNYDE